MTTTPAEPDLGTTPPTPEPVYVTVDITNPATIMAALGCPDARAVVLTGTGALAISGDYPPTPFDPEPPAAPTNPEEAV